MMPKRWSSLTLLLFLSATLSLCDTVELKTGERLEGTFKQANAAGVVIEVGGQALNMPLAKVRAIYFGAAPSAQGTGSQTSGVRGALQALKALQSITNIGVNYRDYSTRVADTKVKVDQFVQSPQQKDVQGRKPIRLAMRYYELAAQAWGTKFTSESAGGLVNVGRSLTNDKELASCATVKGTIASANSYAKTPEEKLGLLGALIQMTPSILWTCASDKIAEAERLLGK